MYEPDGRPRKNLAATLRELRRAAGLSGERLAARTALSQSKLSRIECGQQIPTVADTERILKALEVPSETVHELLAVARAANVDYVSFRALARVGLWQRQSELQALAESARVVRVFLPAIPSGLLQTRDYAHDVLTPTVEGRAARNVTRAVEARMARQSSLTDESRHFRFVLTEQAVRWPRTSPDVVADQILNIVKIAKKSNVDLAVIPFAAGEVRASPLNVFTVYDERLVSVETFSGSMTLRDPRDVSYHVNLWEYFYSHALTGAESQKMLVAVANEVAQPRG